MNIRKEFWLLLSAFILPIVLGVLFFYLNPNYFTQNTVNYGKLVEPIITTAEEDIVFSEKTPGTTQGIWTLVYVTNQCASDCAQTIKDTKTIRILMNDEMRRIQRMVLTNNESLTVDDPKVIIAKPSSTLSDKLSVFGSDQLFLIDPIGNVMLHYQPQGLDIRRVVKDLERLFKYSRIG